MGISFSNFTGGTAESSTALPGAGAEVLSGKFKRYALSSATLPAGSYVGTALASVSGTTNIDLKKQTSGAAGALRAGVTTIDTFTSDEAGISFFAPAVLGEFKDGPTGSSNLPYNADFDASMFQELYNYPMWGFKSGSTSYVYVNSRYRTLTGVWQTAILCYKSTDGKNWNYFSTLSDVMPTNYNNSAWKDVSWPVTTNGKTRIVLGPYYTASDYYSEAREAAEGTDNWTSTQFGTTSYFYNQSTGPQLAWEYGGDLFCYAYNDDQMRITGTSFSGTSVTNIQGNFPDYRLGSATRIVKTGVSSYVIFGNYGYVYTTDDWATNTFYSWSSRTSGSYPYIMDVDYGAGYYVAATQGGGTFLYSTDLVNWTVYSPGLTGGYPTVVRFDTVNNRWWASNTDETYLWYSNSSNPSSTWSQTSGNNLGWINYALDSGGTYLYGALSNANTIYYASKATLQMQSAAQSWSENMYMRAMAVNSAGTVWVGGGYGSITGSGQAMMIRSTDGINFTEIVAPFINQSYVTQIHWDDTNSQFVAVVNGGQFATSPDGLTWTIRGTVDDYGQNSSSTGYNRNREIDGVNYISPNINAYLETSQPDLSSLTILASEYTTSITYLSYIFEQNGNVYGLMNNGSVEQQTSSTPTWSKAGAIPFQFSVNTDNDAVPMQKVNGYWFAFGRYSGLARSVDGLNWTVLDSQKKFEDIAYDSNTGTWIAIGEGFIGYSSNGTDFDYLETETSGGFGLIAATDYVGMAKPQTDTSQAVRPQSISNNEEFGVVLYNSTLTDI